MTLVLGGTSHGDRLTLNLHDPVRPPQIDPEAEADDETDSAPEDPRTLAGSRVETLIGAHAEAMAEACDSEVITDAAGWDGRVAEGVLRDRRWLLEHWRASAGTDEPRYALIVRLAQPGQIGRLLPDVCSRPRVILQRDRQMRHVSRVEQLDPACLRWVARQPGATIAQKAGSRQQVMSVVRVERADTPENRVVKDLVRRCIRACLVYEREHRSFQNHARFMQVRRFRRTLQPLLRHGPLTEVGDLTGPPRPNYVLQFDSRYRRLWGAYQQLLRQERVRDSAWRWRHRLWAETVRMLLMAVLDDLTPEQRQWRSDLLLSEEHVQGCFLDPSGRTPANDLGDGVRVDSYFGADDFGRLPPGLKVLADACPDAVLLRSRGTENPLHATAVWSCLCFDNAPEAADELVRARRHWSSGLPTRGVLVSPADDTPMATQVEEGLYHLALPIPPQAGSDLLREVIRRTW